MEAHGRIAVVAVDHAAVVNQAEALTIPIDLIEVVAQRQMRTGRSARR
jgi:hypothetical protein